MERKTIVVPSKKTNQRYTKSVSHTLGSAAISVITLFSGMPEFTFMHILWQHT